MSGKREKEQNKSVAEIEDREEERYQPSTQDDKKNTNPQGSNTKLKRTRGSKALQRKWWRQEQTEKQILKKVWKFLTFDNQTLKTSIRQLERGTRLCIESI